MAASDPITIAFAGPGDVDFENVKDLLNDWLGFGEEDADGYPEPSDREITIILPITKTHLSTGLETVLAWTEYADLPFVAVTDDEKSRKVTKIMDEAEETYKVANVPNKVISLLSEAEGEKHLVLLWGEEGDEATEILLDLATDEGISAKDLTAGLDDLSFSDEGEEPAPASEPEPEPEPEEKPKRGGRRKKAEPEPLAEDEEELTDDAPEEEPEKPSRKKRDEKAREKALDGLKDAREKDEARKQAERDGLQEENNLAAQATVQGTLVTRPVDSLENRFFYHPATEVTGPQHDLVRAASLDFARAMDEYLPDSREKSLVITKIEEAMFWANAAIARNVAVKAPETPVDAPEEPEGAEEQAKPKKRGGGRPRKDGTPAQPRTEEDLAVAYIKDAAGYYRKRGRGRPRRGEEIVMLTPTQIEELGLED